MKRRHSGETRLTPAGGRARRRPAVATPANVRLQVAVVDARGRPLRANGLERWLTDLASRRVSGAVTVALVSDARVRTLNRMFRHVDRATDVLSFPTTVGARPTAASARAGRHLGDVVIAVGVAGRQAQQFGHSWATEVRILALHGLLHLIGYDHDAPSDDGAMARIERTWRRRGGLPDGLIDRARGSGARPSRRASGRAAIEEGTLTLPRGSGARPSGRASGRADTGEGTPD